MPRLRRHWISKDQAFDRAGAKDLSTDLQAMSWKRSNRVAAPLKTLALNSFRPRAARALACGCGRIDKIMPPIQYWFAGTALATFLAVIAAVSTLGYGWYRAAITEMESANNKIAGEANKIKTEQTKRLLGEALASGGKLIGAQAAKNDDQYEKDANEWGSKTHNLIENRLWRRRGGTVLGQFRIRILQRWLKQKQSPKLDRWSHEADYRTSSSHGYIGG
jgi:hypothetical protein